MQVSQPSLLMLTPDRQIDRRILLQADTLGAAGWAVTIIAMPLDTPVVEDPRVVRIGSGAAQARRENLVLDTYKWIRNHLPVNGAMMRLLKRLAWRYLVDQESFYLRLFYGTATPHTGDRTGATCRECAPTNYKHVKSYEKTGIFQVSRRSRACACALRPMLEQCANRSRRHAFSPEKYFGKSARNLRVK